MSLVAQVEAQVGELRLVASLEVAAGEVVGVVGPNGAGKTSLLRCVAGLLALDDGSIELDGRVLDRPPSRFVAPRHRRVGVLRQDHRLFPHLDARDNVAFGLRARGARPDAARAEADAWLERLGVSTVAHRLPDALSGGERQRVALARALAASPAALVLDEPFAALDLGTRAALRPDVARHVRRAEVPVLLVTHDPEDLRVLADRVAVMEGGRLVQLGTPDEVAAAPATRHAALLLDR